MTTVADLIDSLQSMNPNAEVRLATQPRYPLEYRIDDVVEVASGDDEDEPGHSAEGVVYLAEGGQVGYLPKAVKDELGW
jgi:hypothetical protein